MALTVEIVGFDGLLADIAQAGGNAKPLMKAAITNSVNKIQSNVRGKAAHRTGTLQRSIQTQVDYPQGEVSVGEKYGKFLEEGTGIYVGHSKWKGNIPGVGVRWIKGMKARPFFKPGVEEAAPYIEEQFTKVADILVKGLAGRGF